MITHFLKTEGTKLVLLFLGYAQDERPFEELEGMLDHDTALAVVYDYNGTMMRLPALKHYSLVRVIAWSMGVMMAPQLMAGHSLPYERRYAVNGSIEGIDEKLGIAPEIWEQTICELDEKNALNFIRLMCRNPLVLKKYLSCRPRRDLISLRQELEYLLIKSKTRVAVEGGFYDRAFISRKDLIMPPQAVKASFEARKVPCEMIAEPHYAFETIAHLVTMPFEE